MGTLRVEDLGPNDEVVNFIDLRGEISAERLIRARHALQASRAIELGDVTLAETVKLDLIFEEL